MKSTIFFTILLVFNTTAIFLEPIYNIIKSVDLWALILLEVVLIISFFVYGILKDINKTFQIELNNLKFYPKSKS